MLGDMLEGLLRVVFRLWTIGLFYFINNRFLSWLKESRTLKIPYQNLSVSSEEETIVKPHQKKESKLCSCQSKNSSWNNLIFMNMLASKNRGHNYRQIPNMVLPETKKQSFCDKDIAKDNYSNSNLVISWDLPFTQSSEDFGKDMQGIYDSSFSKNSGPVQCFSRNFLEPRIYSDCFCGNFMDKEREKQEQMSHLTMENVRLITNKMDSAIYEEQLFRAPIEKKSLLQTDTFTRKLFPSKEIHSNLDNIIYKGHLCMEKEMQKAPENTEICFWSEDIHSNFEKNFEDYFSHSLATKEVERHNKIGRLTQEELCPKEPHCSSAASIDSGFQSFCSINMAYTCLDICGMTLYISNICHNREGKIIAMTVGFSATEDSSEESIFSDEDEDSDGEDICKEEDGFGYCCDSDEDFIVFDTKPFPTSEQFCPDSLEEITVEVNLNTPCQTFEFQISQTLSPKSNYICQVNVDEYERKFKAKKDREFNFKPDFQFEEEETEDTEYHSAGAMTNRKVQFNTNVKVHKIVAWEYAYRQARLGPWKDFATDRQHFKRKIEEVQKVVEPVLKKKIAMIA